MSGQIRIDRSVIQSQIEAEQMQYEGIIYSVGLHILLFVVALNFKLIERHFDIKPLKKKSAPIPVEITLIDLEAGSELGEAPAAAPEANVQSQVSTAPDLHTRSEQTTVKMTQEKAKTQELTQISAAPIKNPTDAKAEINQQTKESSKVSAVNQAEIQMKLLRERQKRVQRELDEARMQRDREIQARKLASDGVSNLVDEEEGFSLVSPEKFQQYMNSTPSENMDGSNSEFIVNINQVSIAEGQMPCPSDKTYYNPANECRPYPQQLYQPLCYYEYDECLVLMKKYKIKMGILPNGK